MIGVWWALSIMLKKWYFIQYVIESQAQDCSFQDIFWSDKADRARLKVGNENVYILVVNQLTDRIFIDGQCAPGSVLDTVEVQKKHHD